MTFDERCYALLRQIPRGRVSSYRELAHALGTRAYRAVGNAMNKNPYSAEEYPCHRVLKSDGTVGGYAYGTDEKLKRLLEEGHRIEKGKLIDFGKILMRASEFESIEL